MRSLHKSWQDKRPDWTRRVRWYQDHSSIRLEFIDEDGIVNRAYIFGEGKAQVEYDRFRTGTLTVAMILSGEG